MSGEPELRVAREIAALQADVRYLQAAVERARKWLSALTVAGGGPGAVGADYAAILRTAAAWAG